MGRDESVFDGKTLDDAVRKGLHALGLSRAEVMITVLEEGSGGFLGIGARPYRVRVVPRPGGAIREPEAARPGRGGERETRGRDRERGGRGRDRERAGRGERSSGARAERGTRGGRVVGRGDRPVERGPERGPERGERPERGAERGAERAERPERGDRAERGDRGERGGRGGERGGERAERPQSARGEQPVAEPRAPKRENGGDRGAEPARPAANGETGDGRRRRRRRGGRGRGPGGDRAGTPMDGAPPMDMAPDVDSAVHERAERKPGTRAWDEPIDEPMDEPREARVWEQPRESRTERTERTERTDEPREPRAPRVWEQPRESRMESKDEPRESRVWEQPGEAREERAEEPREPRAWEQPREARAERAEEPREPRAWEQPREARPERTESRGPREPREPRRSRPVPEGVTLMSTTDLEAEGIRLTQELLSHMGYDATVTARAEDTRVDVHAVVPDGEQELAGRKGEVRQSLQHILNRMLNKGGGSAYHLQLEVNDFWERREEELAELARQLAEDALSNNGEAVTEYLNAQERRIVHVTLREDQRVKTYALGTGLIKRVAVAPADYPEPEPVAD